jgi:lipoprotein-anchoring transpeptidase ErfK/SrfK
MRVPAPLLLVAAAAGALLFAAPKSYSPAPASPRPMASAPAPDPRTHLLLTSEQTREAVQSGGFITPPKSLLKVDQRMQYGDFVWNEDGVPQGPISIRVDLRTQILSVFQGAHEIGTAVVLYGADSKKTPLGRFPILWKGKNHRSSLYDAPMPYTLRLTGDGIAIHGSDVRWGAATHGCIGVPTEFAQLLFAKAKVRDPVLIVRSAPVA